MTQIEFHQILLKFFRGIGIRSARLHGLFGQFHIDGMRKKNNVAGRFAKFCAALAQ